ncbi:MAG: cation transporter, partial [Planctomycetales bacterium]|nr:cation transporter [Planctomycetales bacterium]NIN76673.1 cation transporter [Planctomycetales bacterium]NIO33861.1 cation transporter [Planctomycetales bacterium]NIO45668.1 cation transporter [Planctomycetales bacterium]NIP68292.1 cation transporter [Planctomycetales bacterium]
AVVAIAAGALAGSVALISFGVDSTVEITSALVVSRRLWLEYRARTARSAYLLERRAARITGGCLLLLALYITVDGGRRLLGWAAEAEVSLTGIGLTGLSLLLMPLLGWAKLRTARGLQSAALRADAFETIACAWLSFTTLSGLVLNAAFQWSWADPLAAMLIIPLIVTEGIQGWKQGGGPAATGDVEWPNGESPHGDRFL